MGTRSLTHVYDDNDIVCTIYRQYDGYPEGHGKDLAQFLVGLTECNGIPFPKQSPPRLFNGMGCLAAQIVKELKKDVGGIYLFPPGTNDCGEEYVYTVQSGGVGNPPHLKCTDDKRTTTFFEGAPKQCLEAIDLYEKEHA